VVTGSARRIGREIALELARRGASVMVHSLADPDAAEQTAAGARALGVRAEVCLADLRTEDGARQLMEAAGAAFGAIDILVNSAAVRRAVPFAQLDFKEWRDIMAIILDGTYLCCHAALPLLRKSRHGRIVNIGGVTGQMGSRDRAHVVAAKAGVMGLTKALAIDLGAHGITVNCVAPGLIEAPGDDPAHVQFRRRHTSPEKVPLGRIGRPEDVSLAVASLCGDDLAYVTGQTVHVNGGVFLW
jgi:3-oxoacyl-[acyl-carrier protein] reductase